MGTTQESSLRMKPGWDPESSLGVRIGKGVLVGAGSVLMKDIPSGAMGVVLPAYVVQMRAEYATATA